MSRWSDILAILFLGKPSRSGPVLSSLSFYTRTLHIFSPLTNSESAEKLESNLHHNVSNVQAHHPVLLSMF